MCSGFNEIENVRVFEAELTVMTNAGETRIFTVSLGSDDNLHYRSRRPCCDPISRLRFFSAQVSGVG